MKSYDNGAPFRKNAEALRKQGDLRDIQKARCRQCGIEWQAPVIGRCPRCHTEGPHESQGSYMIGAPRV